MDEKEIYVREKYLKGLDMDQLFNLYEDIIRHSHYCPCECRCFDQWEYQYGKQEVRNRIKELAYEN